jgi:hypothetical protein
MYCIRKYSNCWAIYDDETTASLPLTSEETESLTNEFPDLGDEKVRTIFTDNITSINSKLTDLKIISDITANAEK